MKYNLQESLFESRSIIGIDVIISNIASRAGTICHFLKLVWKKVLALPLKSQAKTRAGTRNVSICVMPCENSKNCVVGWVALPVADIYEKDKKIFIDDKSAATVPGLKSKLRRLKIEK